MLICVLSTTRQLVVSYYVETRVYILSRVKMLLIFRMIINTWDLSHVSRDRESDKVVENR